MQTHADSLHGRVALVLVLQRHSFMRSCIRALLNRMGCSPVCCALMRESGARPEPQAARALAS